MSSVEIRPARLDDAEPVEHYHNDCFLQTYATQLHAGEFRPPDRDGTRRQLRDWFQPGSRFRTWIATAADRPVGHFTIYDHQLVHLFVEPDRHGTGLGRYLLEHAETTLIANGHSDLELHVRVENLPAIAFYTKAGWVMTDQLIRTIEHGISYDEHIMVKHHAPHSCAVSQGRPPRQCKTG